MLCQNVMMAKVDSQIKRLLSTEHVRLLGLVLVALEVSPGCLKWPLLRRPDWPDGARRSDLSLNTYTCTNITWLDMDNINMDV